MELAKEKLQAELKLLNQATQTLKIALGEPMTEIVRDAVIQRFEYCFELSWKAIQTAARYMGTADCNSPRECVKAAYKMNWIENPDAWFEAMEARNKTSHTYNAKLAMEVYNVAKKFPLLMENLSGQLQKI